MVHGSSIEEGSGKETHYRLTSLSWQLTLFSTFCIRLRKRAFSHHYVTEQSGYVYPCTRMTQLYS
jgi:hypothetical protein